MRYLVLIFLSLVVFDANARGSVVVAVSTSEDIPVHSYIDTDAEYVAMPVSITSDSKYASERAKLIHQLQLAIENAAKKDPAINIEQGVVSLSPSTRSSFSISKSYHSSGISNLYLLHRIDGDSSIYQVTEKLNRFIASIEKLDDTDIHLGKTALAIESPGKYRDGLLKLIKLEIENTKQIMGDNFKASISGLGKGVIVKQLNDKQVRLYIDYSLVLEE